MAISYRLDNTTTLNLAGAWSLGLPSTANVGQWGSGSTGIVNNTSTALAVASSFGGLAVIDVQTLPITVAGTVILSLSSSGIDMSTAGADLTISTPLTSLSSQAWNVRSGRILTLNGARAGNFLNTITGSGTVVLGGASTSTIGLTLTGSTLVLNNAAAIGTAAARLSIASGIISSSIATTLGGSLLTIGGNFSYTGSVDFSFGAGATTLTATPIITVSDAARTLTLAGIVSGSGFGITKAGPGILTLAGINTYNGGTTINAGTASIAADTGLGFVPLSVSPNNIILNGGNLRITAAATINPNRGMTINSGGGRIENALAVTYAGIISGSGALTKIGVGTLTIGGANTYSGSTTIAAGTASISSDGNFGAIPLTPTNNIIFSGGAGLISTATTNLNINRNILLQTDTVFAPATATVLGVSGSISGSGRLTLNGAGSLSLRANNPNLSAFTLTAGTLRIGSTGSLGTITPTLNAGGVILDSNAIIYNLAGASTLNLNGFNLTSSIAAGVTASQGGIISGNGDIAKTGPGLQIFTPTNTYVGALYLDQGTFRAYNANGNLGGAGATLRFRGGDFEAQFAAAANFAKDVYVYANTASLTLDKTVAGPGVGYTFGTLNLNLTGSNKNILINIKNGSNVTSGTSSVIFTAVNSASLATSSINTADNTNLQLSLVTINDIIKLGSGKLSLKNIQGDRVGVSKLIFRDGILSLAGTAPTSLLSKTIFSSSADYLSLDAHEADVISDLSSQYFNADIYNNIKYVGTFNSTFEGINWKLYKQDTYFDIPAGKSFTTSYGGDQVTAVTSSDIILYPLNGGNNFYTFIFRKKGGGTLNFASTSGYLASWKTGGGIFPFTNLPYVGSFSVEGGRVTADDSVHDVELYIGSGSTFSFNYLIDTPYYTDTTTTPYTYWYPLNKLGSLTITNGIMGDAGVNEQFTSTGQITLNPDVDQSATINAKLRNVGGATAAEQVGGDIIFTGLGTASISANSTVGASPSALVLNGNLQTWGGNIFLNSTGLFNFNADYPIGGYPYGDGTGQLGALYIADRVTIGTAAGVTGGEPFDWYIDSDFNFKSLNGFITYGSTTSRWGKNNGDIYLNVPSGAEIYVEGSTLEFRDNITDTNNNPSTSTPAFKKTGPGTLYFNSYNTSGLITPPTYNIYGRYVIAGGTFVAQTRYNGFNVLGMNTTTASIEIQDGAKLWLNTTVTFTFPKNIFITGSATFQNDATCYFAGGIYGKGSFIHAGVDVLYITGSKTYFTGNMVNSYDAGPLYLKSNADLGASKNNLEMRGASTGMSVNLLGNIDIGDIYITSSNNILNVSTNATAIVYGSIKGTSNANWISKRDVGLLILTGANDVNNNTWLGGDAGVTDVRHPEALRGVAISSAVLNTGFAWNSISSASIGGLKSSSGGKITFPNNFILNIYSTANNSMAGVVSGSGLTINKYNSYDQAFTIPMLTSGIINIFTGSITKQDANGLGTSTINIYKDAILINGANATPNDINIKSGDGLAYIRGGLYTNPIDCTLGNLEFNTTNNPTINSNIILPYGKYINFNGIAATISSSVPLNDLNGTINFSPPDWAAAGNELYLKTTDLGSAVFSCNTVGDAQTVTPRIYIGSVAGETNFYNDLESLTYSNTYPNDPTRFPVLFVFNAPVAGSTLNLRGNLFIAESSGMALYADSTGDVFNVYGNLDTYGLAIIQANHANSKINLLGNVSVHNSYSNSNRLKLVSTGIITFATGSSFSIYNNSPIDMQGLNFYVQEHKQLYGIINTLAEVGFHSKSPYGGYVRFEAKSFNNTIGLTAKTSSAGNGELELYGILDGAGFVNNENSNLLFASFTYTGSASRTFNSLATTTGPIELYRGPENYDSTNPYYFGNDGTGLLTFARGPISIKDELALDFMRISISNTCQFTSSVPTASIGSLQGAGTISFLDNCVKVGGNNLSTTFAGNLNGNINSRFEKEGTGTLSISSWINFVSYPGKFGFSGGTSSFTYTTLAGQDVSFDNELSFSGGGVLNVGATTAVYFTSNCKTVGNPIIQTNAGSSTYYIAFQSQNTFGSGGTYISTVSNPVFLGSNVVLSFAEYQIPRYGAGNDASNDDKTTLRYADQGVLDFGENSSLRLMGTSLGTPFNVSSIYGTLALYDIEVEDQYYGTSTERCVFAKNGLGKLSIKGTTYSGDVSATTVRHYWHIRQGTLEVASDASLSYYLNPLAVPTSARLYIGSLDPDNLTPINTYGLNQYECTPTLKFTNSTTIDTTRRTALDTNGSAISVDAGAVVNFQPVIEDYNTTAVAGLNALTVWKLGPGILSLTNTANTFTRDLVVIEGSLALAYLPATAGNSSLGTKRAIRFRRGFRVNDLGYIFTGSLDGVNNGGTLTIYDDINNFQIDNYATASISCNAITDVSNQGITVNYIPSVGSYTPGTYSGQRLLILSGNTGDNTLQYNSTDGLATGSILKDGPNSWKLDSWWQNGTIEIKKGILKKVSQGNFGQYSSGTISLTGGELHLSASTVTSYRCGQLNILTGTIRQGIANAALSASNVISNSGSLYAAIANSGSLATSLTHSLGNLELYRNNTFTGGFRVNSGIVYIKSDGLETGSFGTGSFILSGSGRADFGGYTIQVSSSEFNNTCTASNGTLQLFPGSTSTDFISNGGYITATLANKSNGTAVGLRHLTGNLIVSSSSTYTGLTDIRGGTVTVKSSTGLGGTSANLTISGGVLIIDNLVFVKTNAILSGGTISSNGSTSYFNPLQTFSTYTGTISQNVLWGGNTGFTHRSGTLIISGSNVSNMVAVGATNTIESGIVKCANTYGLTGGSVGYNLKSSIYVTGTLQSVGSTQLQLSGNLRFASGGRFKFGGS